jgi:hypothetical protein
MHFRTFLSLLIRSSNVSLQLKSDRIRIPLAERSFAVTYDSIEQILHVCKSDGKDDLPLVRKDAGFLGDDIKNLGEEIYVEHPVPQPLVPKVDNCSSPQSSTSSALEASKTVPQMAAGHRLPRLRR